MVDILLKDAYRLGCEHWRSNSSQYSILVHGTGIKDIMRINSDNNNGYFLSHVPMLVNHNRITIK